MQCELVAITLSEQLCITYLGKASDLHIYIIVDKLVLESPVFWLFDPFFELERCY
jgi:hypothetical protein